MKFTKFINASIDKAVDFPVAYVHGYPCLLIDKRNYILDEELQEEFRENRAFLYHLRGSDDDPMEPFSMEETTVQVNWCGYLIFRHNMHASYMELTGDNAIDYRDDTLMTIHYFLWHFRPEQQIEDSGNRTLFSTGAVRDIQDGKGRFDLLPWNAIWEVAKHCEEGAKKYGEHNVDKGIPQHSLIDSAERHLAKYILGWKDEDHLRAAAWNILWALDQRTTHPELNDLPAWKEEDIHE